MKFFDKIREVIGIGESKIELEFERREYKEGENFKGIAKLYSGERKTKISAVLLEFGLEKEGIQNKIGDYKISAEFLLDEKSERDIEFEVILPEGIKENLEEEESFYILAKAIIYFAADVKTKDYVVIKNSKEV